MSDSLPRLVVLPQSPWSERARWALDHHRLGYELVVHVPLFGERRLRRLVGPAQKRATVPVLVLPGAVLTASWDIVRHAERHGHSTPLLPEDRLSEIRRYTDLADRAMESGRALLMRRLLASAGSRYALGSFTYADIVLAGLLQSVVPVVRPHIPLGPATRRVWTSSVLAEEFPDLVAWRDQLYEQHRFASAASATSPVSSESPAAATPR